MEMKNNNAELILFLKNVGFDNYLKYLKSKLKNKRILIYGAGLLFQTIYSNYDLSNLKIVGISDMSFSAKSELNNFCNLKVYKPSEINSLDIDCILVATLHHKKIIENLRKSNKNFRGKILSIYEKSDFISRFARIFRKKVVRNNEFLLIMPNGKIIKNPKIKGLEVKFFGVNSKVVIKGDPKEKFNNVLIECKNNSQIVINGEPICTFCNVKFYVENNCLIEFNSSVYSALNVSFELGGYGNKIIIGKNCAFGSGRYFSTGENTTITIGNNCMLADKVYLRSDDGHSIIDLSTGKPTNFSSDIVLGNHVWLGYRTTVLKGAKVNDGSVVGFGSIVNKKFEEKNILIAGAPAKKIKENIDWAMETPEEYLKKFD